MTAPWLIYSYIAFAVLILTGFLLHNSWQAKVVAASAAGTGAGCSAQCTRSPHRLDRERIERPDHRLSDDGAARLAIAGFVSLNLICLFGKRFIVGSGLQAGRAKLWRYHLVLRDASHIGGAVAIVFRTVQCQRR